MELSRPLLSSNPALGMPELPGKLPQSGDRHSMDAVATNFESLFLSQVLKEMRQTLEPNGLFAQDNGDILGGLFDMFMSQHLAQAGGFGIAAMIKHQLERTQHHEEPHIDAGLRGGPR